MDLIAFLRNRIGHGVGRIAARLIAEASRPAVRRLWSWLYCLGLFISCVFKTVVKTPIQTRILERTFEGLLSHPVEFAYSNIVVRLASLATAVKEPVFAVFSMILKRIAAVLT